MKNLPALAALALAASFITTPAGAQPAAPPKTVCKAKSEDGKLVTGAPGASIAQAKKSAVRACEEATKKKCEYESCILERSGG